MFHRWSKKWILLAALPLAVACGGDEVAGNDAQPDEPGAEVSEQSLAWQLELGESETSPFEIANAGGAALEFDVQFDADWLDVDPANGQIDPDDALVADATATCPGEVGLYETTLRVETNDPANETIELDAQLDCEAIAPGSLQVVVEGLDDELEAAIDIEGPDDFSQQVTETTLFEEAAVGTYSVSASPVGDDAVYAPTPEETTVEIERQADVDVTIDYQAVPGDLQVHVEGLPDDVDHDIELLGEANNWEVPQDGLLQELPPRSYTLVPADVEDGPTLYEASDVDVFVASDQVTEVSIEYIIDPGYLEIDVDGLPDGVDHDIDVIDAEDEVTSVPQSGELTLEPGSYDISPNEVTDGLTTYEADGSSVDIVSDQTAAATVDYDYIAGELSVDIEGLPTGVSADVELAGNTQTETVTASTTVDALEPGTYTVTVSDVTDGPATYEGQSTSVDVQSGTNDTLTIDYDLIYAELSVNIGGELGGNPAAVTVSNDDGFNEAVGSDQTFDQLVPGDYSVTVDDVIDAPATYQGSGAQNVTIESGDSQTVNVNYQLVSGTLQVSAPGIPSSLSPDIEITGDGFSQTYGSAVTIDSIDPGDYTVSFNNVEEDGVIYTVPDSPISTTVTSDETAEVIGQHEPIPGEIAVDVDELGAPDFFEIHITSSEGFDEIVDAPTTFPSAIPGDFTVTVESVPQDALGNEGYVLVDNDSFSLDSETTETIHLEVAQPALVTTEADDGPGSLRNIIDNSVDGTGIEFYDGVEHVVLSGDEIAIEHSVELFGTYGDPVTIDADDNGRHFNVDDDAYLGLYDLVITGGNGGLGGAVHLASGSELFATDTIFEENHSTNSGGAVYIPLGGLVTIRESIFRHNSSDERGGAISTPSSSSSSPSVDIRQSLLHDNEASGSGGALYLTGDGNRIEDSTLVDNTSERGGAIYIFWNDTYIIGSTITGNSADHSGGVFQWGDAATDAVTGRTIIAGNTATGDYQDIGRTSTEDATSLGYNIIGIEDGGGGFVDGVNNDQVGTEAAPLDPLLEVLADNGGFSMTRAPEDASPARAAIPADACDDIGDVLLLRDQRGERRPAGGTCSIGAYELESQLETFANADMSATSYETGSFVGDNDITWNYEDTRRSPSSFTIDGTSIMFDGDPSSKIYSETLSGGISSLSMQLSQGFGSDNDRQVEVSINGVPVGTSQIINEDGDEPYPVYRFAIDDIDVDGDFDIEIQSVGDAQIVIDNLTWR